jgi:Protein of unknown function (DUF3574)
MSRPMGVVLAALLVLGAAVTRPVAAEVTCDAPLEPWTEVDLYFGRNLPSGAVVSEEQFRQFLADVVTPRFPDGLSVIDVAGQFRSSTGIIVREPSKLLVILVPDAAAVADEIAQVVRIYKRRFDQESVLRAEHPVCIAFE